MPLQIGDLVGHHQNVSENHQTYPRSLRYNCSKQLYPGTGRRWNYSFSIRRRRPLQLAPIRINSVFFSMAVSGT